MFAPIWNERTGGSKTSVHPTPARTQIEPVCLPPDKVSALRRRRCLSVAQMNTAVVMDGDADSQE